MTNLYILHYPSLKALKVGKADDVFNRAKTLQKYWGTPCYKTSWRLTLHPSNVFKVEKALHFLLADFQMPFKEGDGKTEFFCITALSFLKEYIDTFTRSGNHEISLEQGIEVPKVLCNPNKRALNYDTHFRKHNSRLEKVLEASEKNNSSLKNILRIVNILLKHRKRIRSSIQINNAQVVLVLYRRKFLLEMLFNQLKFRLANMDGSFGFINFAESLQKSSACYRLMINFGPEGNEVDQFKANIIVSLKLFEEANS